MKILVAGARGQIGTSLVKLLRRRTDVQLVALDREILDITDEKSVRDFVAKEQPNVIINAAAYTAVDKAESEPELAFAINRDGPKYLAEAAQSVGSAILHISTDYVFEGSKEGGYSEIDTPKPQCVYGESKLAGELEVAAACEKHIIIRTAWVFSEYGNNFVKTMLKLAEKHNKLRVVGDQYGGPTYANDIAHILITITDAINSKQNVTYGVYHYSGLPHVSWYEFANAIFDEAKKQGIISQKPLLSSIASDEYPTSAKRPQNSMLSVEKINQNFGVKASDWKLAINNLQEY